MKYSQLTKRLLLAAIICLFMLLSTETQAQSLPLRIRPEAIEAGSAASSTNTAPLSMPTPVAGSATDVPHVAMLGPTAPTSESQPATRWVAAQIDPPGTTGGGYGPGTNPTYAPGGAPYSGYAPPPSGTGGAGVGTSAPTASMPQFTQSIEPSGVSPSPSDAALPPSMPQQPNTFMGEVSETFDPVVTQVNSWREQAFRERIVLDYTFIPGGSSADSFGIHDIDLQARFKFPPWGRLVERDSPMATPLYITPGFAINILDWPVGPGLPGSVYEAYVDVEWNPRLGPALATELSLRMGVYSDFRKLNSDSFQIQGRAVGVLTIREDAVFFKAGVIYLAREHVSLLPTVGLVFSPTSDTRFDLVFPDPKLAFQLNTYQTTDIWGYLRAEYGGGSWTMDMGGGVIPQVDYNDVRFAVGLEFQNQRDQAFDGHLEIGYAMDREIYTMGAPVIEPDSMIFFGAGLTY